MTLLLSATMAALLFVVSQRHAEAERVAMEARIIQELADDIHFELLRDAYLTLERLEGQAGRRKPDAAEAAQRASRLEAAGFVIDAPRLGDDGKAAYAVELTSNTQPQVRLLTLRLASRFVAATDDGGYIVALHGAQRRTVARLLGENPELLEVAVRVHPEALELAGRLHLQPGVVITFHPGSSAFRSVQLARASAQDLLVRALPSSVPPEVQSAPSATTALESAWGWPGFLLFGGGEVKHVLRRTEEREGALQHVFYLRDDVPEEGSWRGVSLAVSPALYEPVEALSALSVGTAAAVLVALWALALWRLRAVVR